MLRTLTYRILSATDGQTILHYLKSLGYSGPMVHLKENRPRHPLERRVGAYE